MAHEHHGDCCEAHHHTHHAPELGRLCCQTGNCVHMAHGQIRAQLERQLTQDDEELDMFGRPKKKDKKVTKAARTAVKLAFAR